VADLGHRHVEIRREGGFRHRVTARGHTFVVDEPASLGGADSAASPLELLATALGTCTISTMEMYAERKGWELGAVEAHVDFAPPRPGERARFELTIRLPAGLGDEQVERLETIGKRCPVRRTLDADVVERVERVP
jgi:putative redox protein